MKEVVSCWAARDQPLIAAYGSQRISNRQSALQTVVIVRSTIRLAPLWSKSGSIVSFPRVGAGFQGADASQSAELNRLPDTWPAVRGHRTQL